MMNFIDQDRNEHGLLQQHGTSSSQQEQPPPQNQRYDFRPRASRPLKNDVIQIKCNPASIRDGRIPSPTSVLRYFGLSTYSTYELGAGHYSKVYKAYQSDREVAVKVVRLNLVSEEVMKKFIPRERNCWAKLQHRNICELFTCLACEEYGYLFMVMEYCHNGDLLSYIQRNGALPEIQGRRWLRSLLDAIHYLHKMNIAHRDIKAENVLISRREIVKLTDFGFACEIPDENFHSRTYCGSRAYSSPEVLQGTPYNAYKNDVWSLGVLCYVAMSNSMPFREEYNTNAAIIELQRRRSYRWPQAVGNECRESVDAMLAFYQNERPTAKQAKKLPFFIRANNTQQQKMDFEESP